MISTKYRYIILFLFIALLSTGVYTYSWLLANSREVVKNTESPVARNLQVAEPSPKTIVSELAQKVVTRRPLEVRPAGEIQHSDLMRDSFVGFLNSRDQLTKLSASEKRRLVESFLVYLEVKSEIEAELVKLVSEEGGKIQLKVPNYEENGAEIKRMFYNQLTKDFPTKMELIDDYLGSYFDTAFDYFGLMSKNISVSHSEGEGKIRVEVQATREPSGRIKKGSVVDMNTSTAMTRSENYTYSQLLASRYSYIAKFLPKKHVQ